PVFAWVSAPVAGARLAQLGPGRDEIVAVLDDVAGDDVQHELARAGLGRRRLPFRRHDGIAGRRLEALNAAFQHRDELFDLGRFGDVHRVEGAAVGSDDVDVNGAGGAFRLERLMVDALRLL